VEAERELKTQRVKRGRVPAIVQPISRRGGRGPGLVRTQIGREIRSVTGLRVYLFTYSFSRFSISFFFRWFHSLTHSLTPAPVYLLCQHERGTQSESETERVRQGETRLPTAATKFRFFKLWRLCKRCRTGTRLICLHLATFAARFSRFCEGLVFYWQMENTALRSVFLGGHVGNVTTKHTFCTTSSIFRTVTLKKSVST